MIFGDEQKMKDYRLTSDNKYNQSICKIASMHERRDVGNIYLGACASVCDKEGNIYFSNIYNNGLYKFEYNTQKIMFVSVFPGVAITQTFAHSDAHILDDKILFFPLKAKAIHIVGLHTGEIQEIPVEEKYEKLGFGKPYIHKGQIFFVSLDLKRVHVLDLQSQIEAVDNELTILLQSNLDDVNRSIDYSIYEEGLIICQNSSKYVIQLDITHRTVLKRYVGTNVEMAYYNNNDMWIVQRGSLDLLCIDLNNEQHMLFRANNIEWSGNTKTIAYSDIMFSGENTILTNYYASRVAKINNETKQIDALFFDENSPEINDELGYGYIYSKVHKVGNYLYFIPGRAKHLIRFNICNNQSDSVDFSMDTIDNKLGDDLFKQFMSERTITKENGVVFTLNRYVNYLNQQF